MAFTLNQTRGFGQKQRYPKLAGTSQGRKQDFVTPKCCLRSRLGALPFIIVIVNAVIVIIAIDVLRIYVGDAAWCSWSAFCEQCQRCMSGCTMPAVRC